MVSKIRAVQKSFNTFYSGTSVNSFRGNFAFGSTGIIVRESTGGTIYEQSNGRKVFKPANNVGAIARAVLYTLLMYPNQVHEECLPRESIAWLVEAATTEPVSIWEKHRNATLFELQHNRNPFVDYPEWASLFNFTAFAYSQGRLPKADRKLARMNQKLQNQRLRKERQLIRRKTREARQIAKKTEKPNKTRHPKASHDHTTTPNPFHHEDNLQRAPIN